MSLSDIEIAQAAKPQKITHLAKERLGIDEQHLESYGHFKAKISSQYLESIKDRPDGKLILVTAISPTPAGEGKTTTTVGLGDALNRIGKKAIVCLREPSLGPVFGMKGGAAGGGYAQVIPMEDINLHFTGDFNAIQLAHNLLSALIDNHIHHGNELQFDSRKIVWKRVLDMNDRALREIVHSLGGAANGYPRQDGFDIVVASEVMAILCLSKKLQDLKERLGNIVCGYSKTAEPITARQLKAHGAMTVLLIDALKPNLVQTLENNLAILHGGPFANIAHGCNSVIATKAALKLADFTVTEAGFGADLGAEKFINIKCRKSGLRPDVVVIVATIRALKYHGGVDLKQLNVENLQALKAGIANLARHISNVRDQYGLECVISLNHFTADTQAEIELLRHEMHVLAVPLVVAKHWAEGGRGAVELAQKVVELIDSKKSQLKFTYDENASLWDKIKAVAMKIYGAADISADHKIKTLLEQYQTRGYGHYPVCIAKTQYSFSTDSNLRGAPTGHILNIREVRLAAGAEFIVVVCGDIMTMPGLPKRPSAETIDIDDQGRVIGLF